MQIVTLLIGDTAFDSPKTLAAFALGLVLFAVTLCLNIVALSDRPALPRAVRLIDRDRGHDRRVHPPSDRTTRAPSGCGRTAHGATPPIAGCSSYGIAAISSALGLLGVLVASLVDRRLPAFTQTFVRVDFPIPTDIRRPRRPGRRQLARASMTAGVGRAAARRRDAGADLRAISAILTTNTAVLLRDAVLARSRR